MSESPALSESVEPLDQKNVMRDGDNELARDEIYFPEETARWYRARIQESWRPAPKGVEQPDVSSD